MQCWYKFHKNTFFEANWILSDLRLPLWLWWLEVIHLEVVGFDRSLRLAVLVFSNEVVDSDYPLLCKEASNPKRDLSIFKYQLLVKQLSKCHVKNPYLLGNSNKNFIERSNFGRGSLSWRHRNFLRRGTLTDCSVSGDPELIPKQIIHLFRNHFKIGFMIKINKQKYLDFVLRFSTWWLVCRALTLWLAGATSLLRSNSLM